MNRNYLLFLVVLLFAVAPAFIDPRVPEAYQPPVQGQSATIPGQALVSLSDFMAEYALAQDAGAEKGEPAADHSLFESVPLGWNLYTIKSFYNWVLALPFM